MQHEVIPLAFELCEIPSTTGDEARVVEKCQAWLKSAGFEVSLQPVPGKPEHDKGRANLLAVWPGCEPKVLLSTHLDTVPPHIDPYLSQDQQWLCGRGVCDAKGIAAAMMVAAKNLVLKGHESIGLLLLVGEETISDGARLATQFVPKVDFIINGEPTDLKLVSAMKGAFVFELEVLGKPGHSAYPASGHSAIHQLIDDMKMLLEYPWPSDAQLGDTTVNFGRMEGGVAANVIAERAFVTGVVRTAIDTDAVLKMFQSCLSDTTSLRVVSKSQPQVLNTTNGFDTCVVSFGSDIPHLASLGKPLLIGPGSILDAHTAHERVRTDDLIRAVSVYEELAKKLFP